jgi:hypothetical protein
MGQGACKKAALAFRLARRQWQGPLQLQLPPEQSIVQLAAPLQSALHDPPGQWNVQVAPFSHL